MGILDASRRSGEVYVRSSWDWLYEPVDQLIRFSKAALVIFMILGVMGDAHHQNGMEIYSGCPQEKD